MEVSNPDKLIFPRAGFAKADLAYLANQGTVTFHMWTSTAEQPGIPDWIMIDLDPVEGDLDGVRYATTAIRELLAEFDIVGFPLATGSKGFHLWVALDGGAWLRRGFDRRTSARGAGR